MNRSLGRVLIVVSLLAIVGIARAAPVGADSSGVAPPGQYYLALGDSLAYGYQYGKFQAELPNPLAVTFNTGYADDFYKMLRTIQPNIQLVNLACPGESTTSFMQGCAFSQQQHFPLHVSYSGSQMDAALAFLKAHPGQVNPISINLGSNDLLALVNSCGGLSNLSCVTQGYPAALKQILSNLAQILTALRTASPTSEIILLNFYNPFAIANPASNALAVAGNNQVAAVAQATGAVIADVFTPFNLAQPQPATLCRLTLICTTLQDEHASDAGYLVMAEQMWKASGFASMLPGFIAGFISSAPGTGQALFGSGPGCLGLVETATRDMGAGSTVHIVAVIGNDLPGSVGDNGIIAGQAYSYEGVTVTAAGVETDANGGQCYQATR